MTSNRRIVVLGGGESGAGAAVLAKVKGMDVWLSDMGSIAPKYKELLDKYEIAWEEGKHTEEKVLAADERPNGEEGYRKEYSYYQRN